MNVKLCLYHAEEVDTDAEVGWYFNFQLPGGPLDVNTTEEVGPFRHEDDAHQEALRCKPTDWVIDEIIVDRLP